MKKLIILSVLITLVTFCQSQSTVDGFTKTVYLTLKSNDFAAFQTLYLTSKEMEALISTGLFDISESNRQIAINYYKPEALLSDQMKMFNDLRTSDKIAWSQTTYESYEVDMKKEEGMELYEISIQFLINGGVKTTRQFKAIKLPAIPGAHIKEKFVIVH